MDILIDTLRVQIARRTAKMKDCPRTRSLSTTRLVAFAT
jgi:hypothetical protein